MKLLQLQIYHLISLVILVIGIHWYVDSNPYMLFGQWQGISSTIWFWIAILSPILHQIYVL